MKSVGSKKKHGKSSWSKFQRAVTQIDLFGEGINFTVDDGKTTYGTLVGTLLTLFVASYCLVYGVKKWDDMMSYQETTYLES